MLGSNHGSRTVATAETTRSGGEQRDNAPAAAGKNNTQAASVMEFSGLRNVRGLSLDHKMGCKFKSGRNILTGFALSRAGPKWTNFSEIRLIRAESQNRGVCDRWLFGLDNFYLM
jgi:hypothetical protein